MKKLFLSLALCLAISFSVQSQTALSSWWSLKYCTSYSNQNVRAFDSLVSTNGSGYFVWFKVANNTSITDIPGIQIKPKGTTKGYWKRSYDGQVQLDWMGGNNSSTQRTWTEIGYSQNKLDSMYGAFGAGFINTSYKPDESALKCAYKLMNTAGYNSIALSPKKYYLWIDPGAPGVLTGSGLSDKQQFEISGNCAVINLMSASARFLNRTPTDQTQANTDLIGGQFIISNLIIDGHSFDNTGIRLCATSNSMVSAVTFKNCYIGLDARFCLQLQTFNTEGNNSGFVDIIIANGDWSGASPSNSQSNRSRVNGHRCFGGGGYCGIWVKESSNVSLVDIVGEGGGANWLILLDCRESGGSSIVKEFLVDNLYGEGDFDSAAVGIFNTDGLYTINRVYFRGTRNIIWVQDLGDTYPQLNLYEVAWWPVISKIVQIGNGWCWDVKNFNKANVNSTSDFCCSQNLFDSTYPLAQQPLEARVRIAPKIIN